VTGRQSKRIGKDGERNAKKLLTHLGCHLAMSEVSGLAGDDVFIKDPNGKWWSVEVKHTKDFDNKHLAQAKRQADERYEAIQNKLNSAEDREVYEVLKLNTFTRRDWMLMWRPRCAQVSADEWHVWYSDNGTIHLTTLGNNTGWFSSRKDS